jgi:hypothetical protein
MGGSCVKLTITPIPVDRPPLPLPNGVKGPIYFTIQPGGSYVNVIGSSDRQRPARKAPFSTIVDANTDLTSQS